MALHVAVSAGCVSRKFLANMPIKSVKLKGYYIRVLLPLPVKFTSCSFKTRNDKYTVLLSSIKCSYNIYGLGLLCHFVSNMVIYTPQAMLKQ